MYEHYGLFIDGDWRCAADGATYETVDPATEESLGVVPSAGESDVAAAIEAAARGMAAWRTHDPWSRSRTIRRIGELIEERIDDIAQCMSREVGKPVAQSTRELRLSIDQFIWYSEETKRIDGQLLESRVPGGRIMVSHEPVGVVAAFTAWNFPAVLAARKIAPALAAGCAVILRPSKEAPGTAMRLVACCHDAGLPPGVIGLLTGSASTITPLLMASPVVRKISLTGSTDVGKQLLRAAADTVKRVSMELGGHAPVIVCDDCDAPRIAELSVPVKFANAGQVCVTPNRFYVHERVAHAFTRRFVECTRALKLGHGLEPTTDVGPLTTRRRLERVDELVAASVDAGADLLTGGRRPPAMNRGYFYEPTVLGAVPDSAPVMQEEPFGPIAAITTFSNLDDAVRRANDNVLGLAGYVFTRSLKCAHELSGQLRTGMVGVNTYALAAAEAPFGGVKESGFGREGGALGIKDYLDVKYTHLVLD